MKPSQQNPQNSPSKLSRRGLLGGAVAGAGIVGVSAAVSAGAPPARAGAGNQGPEKPRFYGQETIPCHGKHQAGVETEITPFQRFVAFTLRDGVGRDDIARMLRVITSDIELLTQGKAPIVDTEPELAEHPARLTVTVGFGSELVRRVNPAAVPAWLKPVREFPRDRLEAQWNGGDLLLHVAADDLITVSHATRMLSKSVASFTTPLWVQEGFRRARSTESSDTTMRNLMGQVDGTENPVPGSDDFAGLVWHGPEAGWMENGTVQVFRRIRMEMHTWDQIDRVAREGAIGRTLATGAPLTGKQERDEPDWDAKDSLGFPLIPDYSHIRRAHSFDNPGERIFRRSVNYDTGSERGLLFVCYQKDPAKQFESIQARLDELDLLNEWITHIGSAVFAIVPGWEPGGMIGESLFAV